MDNKFLFLSHKDIHSILRDNYSFVIESVEDSLRMLLQKTAIQTDKISHIFNEKSQNRINCMTATLNECETCGIKWVSVFPSNRNKNLKNVESFTILSETATGHIKCVMNSTEATNMRTAAMGAIAAKYLAKTGTKSIGFIGAGEEAKHHFHMIKYIYPAINRCYVSSRTQKSVDHYIAELSNKYKDVTFVNCGMDFRSAAINSDIIVTATSAQETILKANWIKHGALYIHVAGLEDEYSVAKSANKIICDSWEDVKHRKQTISQMYKNGTLSDHDIYGNINEIIIGNKVGRVNDDEFIYFDSVGLAIEDILLGNRIYEKAISNQIGTWLEK